jgi:hypothetical protein
MERKDFLESLSLPEHALRLILLFMLSTILLDEIAHKEGQLLVCRGRWGGVQDVRAVRHVCEETAQGMALERRFGVWRLRPFLFLV